MTVLREYQQRTIDMLYAWFEAGHHGNPCLVLPTGSGKSHIVAALCKDALQNWPETRILMLTHVKELIEQNAQKMHLHWPGAPLGIYSAGIGQRQLGEPITFAGIQSVRSRAQELGHVDLVVIDECHLVNHKDEGGYRKLLKELTDINPALRVVGLTATPYRLGHGYITDKPALFSALIEPVGLQELIYKGFLAPLRSKATKAVLDVSGVHKRGGDYIESELQAAVDVDQTNQEIAREILDRAGTRSSWIVFCAGVRHAEHMAEELQALGISAACVTGETPKKEREQMLTDFKSGKLRALTNANVLTTGFDHPDVDLIALLRPTMSPGLYVQMAGRGMRIKSHTDHCLVLDFAGVIASHGPITAVVPPRKPGEAPATIPAKKCPQCDELCHAAVHQCPHCGHQFPPPARPKLTLRDDDIMGREGTDMSVSGWRWRKHVSSVSGKQMIQVTYYPKALNEKTIPEYFPILHDGYAGQKAAKEILMIMRAAGRYDDALVQDGSLDDIAAAMNASPAPSKIQYKQDGKFARVLSRSWS